jgi:hypothetical protein
MMTPLKRLKKLDHKNAIKYENIEPPPRFSHNPNYPPQKNFEMTVHLWGREVRSENVWHKNEKGDPLECLITPSTPQKNLRKYSIENPLD